MAGAGVGGGGRQRGGRPLAARLLADGETVVDVPAKLAARVRVFDTGHGRKTDATDAHSIAVVALRTRGLRRLVADEDLTVLRLLADRRDELSRSRNRTLNRLHRLLAELVPAGAPRHLSVLQAKALLASVRPRGVAGRTRRALAAELVAELKAVEGKLKALKRRLADAVTAAGSGLMDVYGIGPAAEHYFSASANDLSLGQSLFLTSILPNPKRTYFAPTGQVSKGWLGYLHRVMKIMRDKKKINDEEFLDGISEVITRGVARSPRVRPSSDIQRELGGDLPWMAPEGP